MSAWGRGGEEVFGEKLFKKTNKLQDLKVCVCLRDTDISGQKSFSSKKQTAPESLPIRDPSIVIYDGVSPLSATEDVLWQKMYEHSTRAFNFLESILAMGGLSSFYPTRPITFMKAEVSFSFVMILTVPSLLVTLEMSLWSLLQADCR
ncbi:hypothetical protein HanXRQr2_Chr11g0475821 [Helianthus annuus]|uniref:Uncharacterized protein n=1 Tax=Helianthus annuus TaxID=4232 RepID=A0A9K3HLS4_HELAN|nr:hypothetical protein HanXRQr2_Chr11g0475821 [Helianthus annuus]KAJ0508024.1 hypothetical protein HanIR_Chr11g0512751 [Helianthus annuus]KAJ0516364.1 hypothetical protein HanHA89_Chr11g0413071 [Helianthus annuus]